MVPSAASFIARPSDSELRHLQRARHADLAHALGMTPEDFTSFKVCLYFLNVVIPLISGEQKIIGEKLRRSLDRTRQLKDQDPSVWSKFLQWVCFFFFRHIHRLLCPTNYFQGSGCYSRPSS